MIAQTITCGSQQKFLVRAWNKKVNKQKTIVPLREKTMAEINFESFFFLTATTSICVVALDLPRLVAPDVPTISHTLKRFYCLLLPIASRGRPARHVAIPGAHGEWDVDDVKLTLSYGFFDSSVLAPPCLEQVVS